jgi:hypothetical protein
MMFALMLTGYVGGIDDIAFTVDALSVKTRHDGSIEVRRLHVTFLTRVEMEGPMTVIGPSTVFMPQSSPSS